MTRIAAGVLAPTGTGATGGAQLGNWRLQQLRLACDQANTNTDSDMSPFPVYEKCAKWLKDKHNVWIGNLEFLGRRYHILKVRPGHAAKLSPNLGSSQQFGFIIYSPGCVYCGEVGNSSSPTFSGDIGENNNLNGDIIMNLYWRIDNGEYSFYGR